ncbi:exo-beta-N-acetylmuramidase NamZ family protein [Flavobacterium myungsuense]|uniref:Exo-beta-N-acetylmuramidase NamZ domain-containing protein n=1 Tax=Flavobacterium myungsuense TaxID=651823 RepID=A0ABW3J304_9FLAO
MIFQTVCISIRNLLSKSFLLLLLFLAVISCKTAKPINYSAPAETTIKSKIKSTKFLTGADNVKSYFSILKNKKVGIVTNQTGMIAYDSIYTVFDTILDSHIDIVNKKSLHIVDYIKEKTKIELVKIYAPEHGFRGTADAGELIIDGKDTKTGLPIISLYGNNKKPTPEQLAGIDVLVFDLQDVGARFYTYISSLHYIMEACAQNNVQLIILDRPNPNGGIVDGPLLEKDYSSFVGMHPIPVLHGMTIGEYALMINGQKWLKDSIQCHLKIVPCENYLRGMTYSLPVKPSPNLPNDQSINLYASLCFFEGTNVSVGRGTDKQFQIYGSPYLPNVDFCFVPMPNLGAKDPVYNGRDCFGEDLSGIPKVKQLELKWLIKAYNETEDKSKFFNSFFTKLAGTKKLQQQIESGIPEADIRASWQKDLEEFKKMRNEYLIY